MKTIVQFIDDANCLVLTMTENRKLANELHYLTDSNIYPKLQVLGKELHYLTYSNK